MNVGWLQDFLTLAEVGNFTRAAKARNASQAAFSRRIMALEHWLKAPLIDRSVYPVRLTSEGERFFDRAVELVSQITDARADLHNQSARTRDEVRVALPHTLATSRLAGWSDDWASNCGTRHVIITGNVHEMVTSFVEGGVDLLICFHNPQQPSHLSSEQFERITIGTEFLRPYASKTLAESLPVKWYGSSSRPTPMLMYSPGAYLARMVDLLQEKLPYNINGTKVAESDMADVLRALAISGQGVAWLPTCSANQAPVGALHELDDYGSLLPLSIVAYRDRSPARLSVQRLWERLLQMAR